MVQALSDNSLAVFRAMRRFRNEAEQEQVERVLTSYEVGSFLVDRLGAGLVIDRDLAVVLLDLRRRLIGEYGDAPAATMLIDRAVVAYQDFIRVSGRLKRATSCRNSERHDRGMTGRHRRNQHPGCGAPPRKPFSST